MNQSIGLMALVIHDYDEAIRFYADTIGFRVVEDTYIAAQNKRWVVVAPAGTGGTQLLLAKAAGGEQLACVGNQTGGRVFLFLYTDDLERDYRTLKGRGVEFVREPKVESYGTVAVFKDLGFAGAALSVGRDKGGPLNVDEEGDIPYHELPDVRDGLTREERILLYVLSETQKERGGRNVPTAMLWGRVCEHFYISPEDLSEMLARLGARR